MRTKRDYSKWLRRKDKKRYKRYVKRIQEKSVFTLDENIKYKFYKIVYYKEKSIPVILADSKRATISYNRIYKIGNIFTDCVIIIPYKYLEMNNNNVSMIDFAIGHEIGHLFAIDKLCEYGLIRESYMGRVFYIELLCDLYSAKIYNNFSKRDMSKIINLVKELKSDEYYLRLKILKKIINKPFNIIEKHLMNSIKYYIEYTNNYINRVYRGYTFFKYGIYKTIGGYKFPMDRDERYYMMKKKLKKYK